MLLPLPDLPEPTREPRTSLGRRGLRAANKRAAPPWTKWTWTRPSVAVQQVALELSGRPDLRSHPKSQRPAKVLAVAQHSLYDMGASELLDRIALIPLAIRQPRSARRGSPVTQIDPDASC